MYILPYSKRLDKFNRKQAIEQKFYSPFFLFESK